MPDYPLLLFPNPASADRDARPRGFPRIHTPDPTRQSERLSPMFQRLEEAFEKRRIEIQQSAAGMEPEQMLVMETVGSITDFANAARQIEGLEWMGEEVGEFLPDEDFYDPKYPKKALSGRLYLLMTDQRAFQELYSLWKRFKKDPDMEFVHGMTKFRDLFENLYCIRPWGARDRLRETGIIDCWEEELAQDGDEIRACEIELWFRRNANHREAGESTIRSLVRGVGGQILNRSVIEDIAYHGVLVKLPQREIQTIIDNPDDPDLALVKCNEIMFIRPGAQTVTCDKPAEGDTEISMYPDKPAPDSTQKPVVALLDGLPLANHGLLADRLIVDDPDNWASEYPASCRIHGTSMASLIIHGDLNASGMPLSRPIYVRPIMRPVDPRVSNAEQFPDDQLMVDILHRALVRLLADNSDDQSVTSEIRIINLSIGDKYRLFTRTMSSVARLLDWLSAEYNVLFIVSAGNHPEEISLNMEQEEFRSLSPEELEERVIQALYRDIRHRKLLAPSETLNGLSIGALHEDNSEDADSVPRIDPFTGPLPSPFSAFGSGYGRAIKPDIIFAGGRQWYRLPYTESSPATLRLIDHRLPPGNKVASPGSQAGELNATSHTRGTSNATALVTRAASECYDTLQQILQEQAAERNTSDYEVPLLKAMLVHGCFWGDIGGRIRQVLQTSWKGHQLKGMISQWMGYGVLAADRVQSCTERRATVLGFGKLLDGDAHTFNLPLPYSLKPRQAWRLTITLAWLSPISAGTQEYRNVFLWFKTDNNQLKRIKDSPDTNAAKRGTVQHEIFAGRPAEPLDEGKPIEIKVSCEQRVGIMPEPISYGLVVSLEVAEGSDIAVYNEIRERIAPAIPIRPVPSESSEQE